MVGDPIFDYLLVDKNDNDDPFSSRWLIVLGLFLVGGPTHAAHLLPRKSRGKGIHA